MSASAERASILIVEDERLVAKDLQQTLRDMGYDAFAVASSAEEAVACSRARNPDVVLMDIRIRGDDDGISTATILKKRFPVAVIYLTAHADEAMLERAKKTEPDGYLVKPVKPSELRSMIEITVHRQALERTREQMRAQQRRLHAITDNVPVSIGYFDRHGRVQFANRALREAVQFEQPAEGVAASAFLGAPLHRASYAARQRALEGETVNFTTQIERGGERREYEVSCFPDRDDRGAVVGVYALGYDVTERQQLAHELQQARIDLETILNNVPAGITSWHADLTNRFANQAARRQLGVDPQEAPGRHLRELLGEEAFERALPSIRAALAGMNAAHEQTYPQTDGSTRYGLDEYLPELHDGKVEGLYALSMDITELRRSHDQVRELAQRLERVREEERRKVAAILHDGVAQDLFAMKLSLSRLESFGRRQEGIREICRELQAAVSQCMEDTRNLANELRPVALSYFALGAVIREHARRFARQAGLQIEMLEPHPVPTLSEPARLLLFRAAQEGLTNVARHAQARTVHIRLDTEGEQVVLEVADDGLGLGAAITREGKSLGLLSLKERAEALGGLLDVRPGIPRGTVVRIELPASAGR